MRDGSDGKMMKKLIQAMLRQDQVKADIRQVDRQLAECDRQIAEGREKLKDLKARIEEFDV